MYICPYCHSKLEYNIATDTCYCQYCQMEISYTSLNQGALHGRHRGTPPPPPSNASPGPSGPGQKRAGAPIPPAHQGPSGPRFHGGYHQLTQQYRSFQTELLSFYQSGRLTPDEFQRQEKLLLEEYETAMMALVPTPVYLDLTKEKPTPPLEQTFGEISAFRVWRLGQDGVLTSAHVEDHQWPPGQIMQADTLPKFWDDHSNWGRRTGLHGWKSLTEVVEYGHGVWQQPGGLYVRPNLVAGPTMVQYHPCIVFGRVTLWGHVVEHERGYRAEFARIVGLDDLRDERWRWDGKRLAALQQQYFPKETPDAKRS